MTALDDPIAKKSDLRAFRVERADDDDGRRASGRRR
jgi:hypothetical protein